MADADAPVSSKGEGLLAARLGFSLSDEGGVHTTAEGVSWPRGGGR